MRPYYSSLHRNLILVSKLNDAYKKYTGIQISWCLERFFLRTVCMSAYRWPRWPDQGTTGQTRALKRNGHFLRCKIFGKAQKLSVCHKLVKCQGNLQKNFSSLLFYLDKKYSFMCFSSGPRTTYCTLQPNSRARTAKVPVNGKQQLFEYLLE